MKSSVRALFIPVGPRSLPSSRSRIYDWIPHLRTVGVEPTVFQFSASSGSGLAGKVRTRLEHRMRERQLRDLVHSHHWDSVVIQKALPPLNLLRGIRNRTEHLVFDLTDPIHLATSRNHRWYHKLLHQVAVLPRLRAMVALSNHVLVENDRLHDLVSRYGGRSTTIRGPVDSNKFRPLALGAQTSHTIHYLEQLYPVFRSLTARWPSLAIHVFGTPNRPSASGINFLHTPWSLEAEQEVIPTFDIGISPVFATGQWDLQKGGYKLLLYMACGIPIVSSPHGIGSQVIRDGENGLLANSLDSWHRQLEMLLSNPAQRDQLARTARAEAVEKYSFNAYLASFIDILGLRRVDALRT